MNESDLIKVLKELRVYTQSWNKVNHKDFSCQTDFPEVDNNNNVSFFYCCQFSSSGDAETQCDIPLSQGHCNSCAKSLSVENAATQCNLFKTGKDFSNPLSKRIKNHGRTIKSENDSFFNLGVSDVPRLSETTKAKESTVTLDLGDQHDVCVSPGEEFDTCQTGSKASFLKEGEVNARSKRRDGNSKSNGIDTYDDPDDFDDHHTFEPMDDDDDPDEPNSIWNVQLTDTDKEFSYSEDEKFWQQMSKKRRNFALRIRQKRQKRKRRKCSVSSVRTNFLQGENSRILNNKTTCSSHMEFITNDSTGAIQREKIYSDSLTEYNIDDMIREGGCITEDSFEDNETDLSTSEYELFSNNDRNVYLCDVCGKQFPRSHVLREHIVEMHKDHELAKTFCHCCPHCQRVYSKVKNVEYHLSQFKGPCKICGMIFNCRGLFSAHKRGHRSLCRMYNRNFSNVQTNELPKKSFHETNDIKCVICNRGFFNHSQLYYHTMKFHKNPCVPPHILKCTECHYTTNNIRLLHMHKSRVHTGDNKGYGHDICNETLGRQQKFEHHNDNQNGKNSANFQCKTCYTCLGTQSDLIDHIRISHFDQEQDIQQFNYSSAVQISYPCFPCQIVFASSDELQAHVATIHDVPVNMREETPECQKESIYVIEGSNVAYSDSTVDLMMNPHSSTPNSHPFTDMPPNINVDEFDGIACDIVS